VLTEEYQTYARPYSEIFNLIRAWTGMNKTTAVQWVPDEDALYTAMMGQFEASAANNRLTEKEIAYWRGKAETLTTPIVYQFQEAYRIILENFLTAGFLMLLFAAIALSSSFPDEHTYRTDQLVLCTANGKRRLYWVKLSAGITVGFAGALLMTALTWILSLCIYGSEGFHAAIQIFFIGYAGNITIGQACLIAYGCLLAASLLISVFVMFLSELFHSSIAAISITTAMILAGMLVQIPEEYRILGQIWDYLPTCFLSMWNTFDVRLVTLFGIQFTSYQIVPVFYIIVGALLAFLGSRIYCRRQISGR
jgi:ABC-type transport system involved in multi-copper enzyme maturation permease subunit